MKLGDSVIHRPDGRAGTIVSSMVVKHADDRDDEERFVVEYADASGAKAQAWFNKSDLAPFTRPTEN